jgi:hypothetical protein
LTTRCPSNAPAAPPAVDAALDSARLEELARLAELAASYWRSIALAAERGEVLTATVHCRQVAGVTREAFSIVKAFGRSGDAS